MEVNGQYLCVIIAVIFMCPISTYVPNQLL
jgi:hypothetical protein